MEQALTITATVLGYALSVVLIFTFFQLLDFGTSLLDLRGAHDSRIVGRAARRRITEYVWSIPATVALGLVLALGVDFAGRLLFDHGDVNGGLLVMAGLLLLAMLGGLGIVYAIVRAETPSYATLRANLEEDVETKVATQQLASYRSQLSHIDEKHRKIRFGLRDKARLRRMRAELNELAESFRANPPVGIEALRSVTWRLAWIYLWRGNVLRVFAPILAALVLLGIVIVFVTAGGWSSWWLVLLAVVGFLVVASLAWGSARASLASKTAWHAVYLKQRTEVEDLLIELEKASRKGVVGLGDRVARALQILREQQQ